MQKNSVLSRLCLVLTVTGFHLLTAVPAGLAAQDTFSIVAADTVTGEIGSAGASCVGPFGGVGAFILSDVIEGVGAIHTQASYVSGNQQNAHNQMLLGKSPQEIIDWLVANDVQNNPTIRQYGIVDLTRSGESAAYTGVNCLNYKNHLTAPGYAVQGNILLGQVILDTMQYGFLLNPTAPLADRLMAALEAAKIIGADTRCAPRNTSSQSAFIKVVRIGDGDTPYLEEIVPDTPSGVDPIDVLRGQFDLWKASLASVADPFLSQAGLDTDSLPADGASQALLTVIPKNNSDSLLAPGLTVLISNSGSGNIGPVTDLGNGTYVSTVTAPALPGSDTLTVTTVNGADTVIFAEMPVVHYFPLTAIGDKGDNPARISRRFELYQNYPNPFNPNTTIEYSLPVGAAVELVIYDVFGTRIRTLVSEMQNTGLKQVIWDGRKDDGREAASGFYFYQLKTAAFVVSRRMLLVR